MADRDKTEPATVLFHRTGILVLTAVFLSLQGVQHLLHQVVDIHQLQFRIPVIYPVIQAIGYGMAEGGHRGVVVWSAPFSKKIGKPVRQDFRSGFPGILKEKLLPGALALAIWRVFVSSRKGRLNGRGQHDRGSVLTFF